MAGPMIPNDAAFRALWASDASREQIGAIYGVGVNAVTVAARRAGLPHRSRSRRYVRSAAAVADTDPVMRMQARVDKARAFGDLAGAAFWTAERDRAVIRAAGRWAAMDALARRWGVTPAYVVARWHRLRAV